MWDVLLGAVIGAAAGYAAYKIVDSLWPRFVDLWESFVAVATEIFDYITETTKDFLARIAEFLQDQWSENSGLRGSSPQGRLLHSPCIYT